MALDLVNRQFTRNGPNQLWVTDITEHQSSVEEVLLAIGAIGLAMLIAAIIAARSNKR
ncbi:hypothetical protein [Micromonospora sp. NPDC005197]|uniref:hypothetical protein n=1 Tax=unclassified Micromonospora TaxID=2617518 RepID=UPI0033ACD4CD